LDFTATAKQDQEIDSALQSTRKKIQEANKMTLLLQREQSRNEAYLQPLRENAQKMSFLQEITKSSDGILAKNEVKLVLPLSETTDFMTDQLRTLTSLLRLLRSLPTNTKQGSANETRKVYLEKLISAKMSESGLVNLQGEGWTALKEKYDKIGTLEDLRKLEGRN
jgi:hypothetical protein